MHGKKITVRELFRWVRMTEATTPTQRAAVIDCGTNMFTVLIAEGSGDTWERKHVLRQPVFIGQGGFQNCSIRSDGLHGA